MTLSPANAKIVRPIVTEMEDVQGRADTRRLPINRVGIKDIRHPVRVKDRSAGEQHTIAQFNMYVSLPHNFKGTHMSRFVEILHAEREISVESFRAMLTGLTAQARAAGLEERIVFAGFVPDIASWLKRSRAVVAVSLVEGHPSAVLEAMAAGVPVVVSDIPAYRSLLNDDSASFVPAGDPLEIAAALVRTLEDRRSAGERAARAKEGMRSLSLEVAVTRYEDIYRRLLAGRGTR